MTTPNTPYTVTINIDDTLSESTVNLASDEGIESIATAIREAVGNGAASISITAAKQ